LAKSGAARARQLRATNSGLSAAETDNGPRGSQEGFFGFLPFPEVFAGRMAMMGFASGVTGELLTGRGILGQLGADTPDLSLFVTLAVLMGGATAFATARTLFRLTSGSMTVGELRRYSSFFGLSAEAQAQAEAMARKRAGDFTGATDLNAIDAARSAGTLADAALMTSDATAVVGGPAPAAAAAMPAATAAPKRMTAEEREVAYAKNVELVNGRWVRSLEAQHALARFADPIVHPSLRRCWALRPPSWWRPPRATAW
jgi:hypothetical protein